MEKVRYMISDAATMAGVESHVLRYWEDELDLTIPRNEMGHRYYTRENILEFQRIKSLKEQGYQLKAIRTILHNGGDVPPPLVTVMKPADSEQAAPAAKTIDSPASGSAAHAAKATAGQANAPAAKATAGQANTPATKVTAGQANAPSAKTTDHQAPAPAAPTAKAVESQALPQQTPVSVLSAEDRMEQFRELMNDIVGRAISHNNEELSLNISQEVHATVLKEMNYLFREQEDAEEERFKKLDAAIRGSLRKKHSLFGREDKPKKEKVKMSKAERDAAKQKAKASLT